MLLSNVIYSYIEEEKKNLAILKILGFSYFDISYIPLLLGILISLIGYGLIILFLKYFKDYFKLILLNIININIDINLTSIEYILIFLISIVFALVSSLIPLINLRKLPLDRALKEE